MFEKCFGQSIIREKCEGKPFMYDTFKNKIKKVIFLTLSNQIKYESKYGNYLHFFLEWLCYVYACTNTNKSSWDSTDQIITEPPHKEVRCCFQWQECAVLWRRKDQMCSELKQRDCWPTRWSIFPFWSAETPARRKECAQTHSVFRPGLLIIAVCRFGCVIVVASLFDGLGTLPPGFSTLTHSCKCSFLAADLEQRLSCGIMNVMLRGCEEMASTQL